MRAEVVGVGTELLLGDIVNGNAARIGQMLAAAGIDCFRHTVVGDNVERIASVLGEALARADAVIVTGGLGPTQDDVTREAIAAVTGRALRRDATLEQRLHARFEALGRAMSASNLRQADVPEGARVIEQTFGTAPGLMVEHGAGVIYAVPGVPAEMEDMLARAVLPDLLARAGTPGRIVSRVVRVAGIAESAVAESLAEAWDAFGGGVTMAYLAGGGEVRVRLTAKAADETAVAALLARAEQRVRDALGHAVVGVDDETLERVVGRLLRARGWTIACAESVTGGALTARMVSVAGASDYLRGGVVAYANELKRDLLGVPPEDLDREGPVSAAAARAMAAGVRLRAGADVGVATTGVAGPAELGHPVGTVILAVAGPLGEVQRELRLPGDRALVRALASGAALNLVRLYLMEALP